MDRFKQAIEAACEAVERTRPALSRIENCDGALDAAAIRSLPAPEPVVRKCNQPDAWECIYIAGNRDCKAPCLGPPGRTTAPEPVGEEELVESGAGILYSACEVEDVLTPESRIPWLALREEWRNHYREVFRAVLSFIRTHDRREADEAERLRVQLAGCLTAAEGWTGECKQGDYGWSPAFEAVRKIRREADEVREVLREVLDALCCTSGGEYRPIPVRVAIAALEFAPGGHDPPKKTNANLLARADRAAKVKP